MREKLATPLVFSLAWLFIHGPIKHTKREARLKKQQQPQTLDLVIPRGRNHIRFFVMQGLLDRSDR